MKKYWRIFSLVLCAIIVLSVFAGCAKDANTEKDKNAGVVAYVGTGIFEGSLDPVKGAMTHAYPFTNNALLKANQESEYVGDLATEWKMVDAKTYTFKLREGVKFSDGSAFTAEDVVFTYETVQKNQASNENVDLSRLESVKAINDYEVEFKLTEAYSPFLDTTAMLQIVPSDSYDSELFDTQPIGTGAYKVAQYDTNQQIILEVNEYYFGEKPAIEKVTLVYMDQSAAFAAAKSKKLDIVMVGSGYVSEEIDGMTLQRFETMDVRNISLPVLPEQTVTHPSTGEKVKVGNNVTSDIAVRKALAIGIDRDAIIENALEGVGKASVNYTDNLAWSTKKTYEDGQLEEAKELLEDAGWVDTDKDGIREKDGLRCSFDIYAPGTDEDRYRLIVALAEDAKKLGIEINAKTGTWDQMPAVQTSAGLIWGWGQYSPTVLDMLYNSERFLTAPYDNVGGYKNAEVDSHIEAAISATSQEDAITNWQAVQDIANTEYPYIYLVNIEHCFFVNDNLDISMETQIPHPHGHGSPIICNLADWSWK